MRRERSGCLLDEGGRARDWPVDWGTGRCPGVQGGREGPADWRGGPGGCQGGACTLQLGLNGLDGKHPGGDAGETRTHCGTVCEALACTVSLPGTQTEGPCCGQRGLEPMILQPPSIPAGAQVVPGPPPPPPVTPTHDDCRPSPTLPPSGSERLTDRTSSSLRVAPFKHTADAHPGAREHCAAHAHSAAFSPRARNGKPLERNEKKGGVGLAAPTANQ